MIVVKNLTKVYKTRGREVRALDNVTFTLPDSGMVFIVGKSGSGKSTLLNMISGLDKYTSGKIVAGGNQVGRMNREEQEKYLSSYIGYVFQDYRLIEDFTVRQNVELAADISASGMYYQRYLDDVGLHGYDDRYPKELSGGQKQRVGIARALIKKPKVILADEPTGNLDKATTKEILDLLKRISKNTLVLIVSHNMRDADAYADRIIELSDGRVIKDETRVEGYKNRFSYEGGVINLPHHKDLEEAEIGEVLRRGRYSKGIVQNTSGFEPTGRIVNDGKRVKLKNKGMSLFNLGKLFSIFFKRKFVSKIVTVFLAAVILSVFYVIQALTLYNTNTAIVKTQTNSGAYGVVVQAAGQRITTDKLVGHLSEKKIQNLADAYDGNAYRLYSEYLYTNMVSGGEGYASTIANVKFFYCQMTYGTLNTTEEYAAKVLGTDGLKVLAGDIYDKDYGMVITDYVADSMIANCPMRYSSYEDVLGLQSFFGENTYINAVVDTNYEQEHSGIRYTLENFDINTSIDTISTDQSFISFFSDVSERYAITYNFAQNYEEALREFKKSEARMVVSVKVSTSKTDYDKNSLTLIKDDSYGLERGEILLPIATYNTIFKKNYTLNDLETGAFPFSPMDITISQNEGTYDPTTVCSHKLRITGIADNYKSSSSSVVIVGSDTFEDLIEFETYTYSVYLDDAKLAEDVVDVIEENMLSIYSGKIGNVYYIERCVNVFGKFLKVTEALILVACMIFLVNFGIKSIRSNIYEIGVIKSMGGVKRDISKIFISQSAVMGVGILLVTYIGMQVGSYVANQIFLESLQTVIGTSFYGIRAIDFYPDIALADIAVALAVVIVSAVISTKSIDKLNLISILKAKE